jgi:hypothetical protein
MKIDEIMELANSLSNNDLEHLLTFVSNRVYVWHEVNGTDTLSKASFAYLEGACLILSLERE